LAESIPPGEAHAAAISAVVPHYLEYANVDLAAELANSVDDPFTRDRLLISVAAKCAEIDDDEYALQLVEAIEDPGLQAQGYEQVGIAKADKGEFEKAGEVSALMVHPDGILVRVAMRQAADGDEAAALATISEIEYARDAVIAFNAIAAEMIRTENLEPAAGMLSRAAEKAADIEHDEERIRSFIEIGQLFIDATQKTRAVEIYETARAESEQLANVHRDNLLAQAAIGFLNAGSVDLADRALDAVSDKTQIATVVLAFARDHWRKVERSEALEALEESFEILRSQHENETRDSKSKFALMATIATQFAGFEQAERALEAADTIPDERQRADALSRIAAIFAVQGNEPLARETLALITDPSQRFAALIGMSDAVADTEAELSGNLLREAESSAEEIELLGPKAEALLAIAGRHSRAGRIEKLRSTISKLLSTAGDMRDEVGQVSTLAGAGSLIESSRIELHEDDISKLRSMLGSNRNWTGV
jgi:hypothetical protein